jgi:hypothetical protein
MRVTNEVPVEIFVTHAMRARSVERHIEAWHVDREVLGKILVKILHEMGMYTVQPYSYADHLLNAIPGILKSSSEVMAMVGKAHRQAMARQASRRAGPPV